MWLDKLKINKQLLETMIEAGYSSPKEIQEKTMTRINGGQDIVAIGPEGCGKTTTYVLSVIMRLKYPFEEAPRALVLVPDKERVLAVVEQFELLGKHTGIRTLGVFAGGGMEPHMDALADGVDVIVGTPDRVRALYLKLGLNTNKILMFILDDAELIIKKGLQLPVIELSRSLPKCQHLVFTELMHDKLDRLISPFLNYHHVVEIIESGESKMETYDHQMYLVPNFRTKLNLLNLLMADAETYKRVVVFVNTPSNAEKLYGSLKQRIGKDVILYKPADFDQEGCDSMAEFKGTEGKRVLVVGNDDLTPEDLKEIPFIIHFELPAEKETFIDRIKKRQDEEEQSPLFISFVTDIELILIKKIEHSIGKKMETTDLPAGLRIEIEITKKEDIKEKTTEPTTGAAFHEKKESNSKTYNYGYKDKQKMSGKISKRRNS